MIDNQQIQDLQIQYGRDVNLLTNKSNAQVRSSLNRFKDFFKDNSIDQNTKSFFFQNVLFQNFVQTFSYPSDSVRELSFDVLQIFLSKQTEETQIKNELASSLLQSILDRVTTYPFREDVEEIRIKILNTLTIFMNVQLNVFKKELSLLITSIEALLQDKYHDIKKNVSKFLTDLCKVAPNQIGQNCEKLLKELKNNLRHQHKKVRLSTLEALQQVLVLPNAGQHLGIVLGQILKLQNDKYPEVRQEVLECVQKCLMNFELDNLEKFEDDLILCLVSGMNEEKEGIREIAQKYLENFGERRKILFDKYNKQLINNQNELHRQISEFI